MYPLHLLASPEASSHIIDNIRLAHPPFSSRVSQSSSATSLRKPELHAERRTLSGMENSAISSYRIAHSLISLHHSMAITRDTDDPPQCP